MIWRRLSGIVSFGMAVLSVVAFGDADAHPLPNQGSAIAAARKICLAHHRRPSIWESDWHARLDADHWHAWQGDKDKPGVSIDLPKDGRPVRACEACVYQMGWTTQEGPNRLAMGCDDDHRIP
jgi:hypothetical protein